MISVTNRGSVILQPMHVQIEFPSESLDTSSTLHTFVKLALISHNKPDDNSHMLNGAPVDIHHAVAFSVRIIAAHAKQDREQCAMSQSYSLFLYQATHPGLVTTGIQHYL